MSTESRKENVNDNLLLMRKAIENYMTIGGEKMIEYFRSEAILFALATIAEALAVLVNDQDEESNQ